MEKISDIYPILCSLFLYLSFGVEQGVTLKWGFTYVKHLLQTLTSSFLEVQIITVLRN